jgi:hypothetical protein
LSCSNPKLITLPPIVVSCRFFSRDEVGRGEGWRSAGSVGFLAAAVVVFLRLPFVGFLGVVSGGGAPSAALAPAGLVELDRSAGVRPGRVLVRVTPVTPPLSRSGYSIAQECRPASVWRS